MLGVGILIGIGSPPGDWYRELMKPNFTPPNWIFAPAWTILYIFIAIAGWRTFTREPSGPAMGMWGGQLVLNWLWSPVFFTLHLPWPAFAIIIAMIALVLSFIADRWSRDRLSAVLFIPYGLWLAYAGALNLSIAVLNG
ncbi:tryptophan-rich sensory protein [Rhodobacterales bacterium]|nr:tryptophan-rich sensory protein [Rhodobacterales bacterium]